MNIRSMHMTPSHTFTRKASAALIFVAAMFATGSAHAQRDGGAPEALQLAPSATLQTPDSGTPPSSATALSPNATPSANGLRIAPGSKANPQAQPPATGGATPPAHTGPDAEEIVRLLTGAEPLQPPRDIARTSYWQANGIWLAPSIIAVLIAAAAISYGLYRRSKRPIILSPQLLALRAIDLAHAHGDDKLYAIAVSDAVRGYLEARFQLRAPEQTTEEFLREARRSTQLPPAAVPSLAHLLELCDLAKFARQGLSESQRSELAETAQQLVLSLGAVEEVSSTSGANAGRNTNGANPNKNTASPTSV